jgi:uncharacterized coiled-coil protein SlyX
MVLEENVMYDARFARLESESSFSKGNVARIQIDLAEAKSQVRTLQAELDRVKCSLDTLRNEVRRDYAPWDVVYRRCERFLNFCALGMAAVLVLALAHGFKWI